MTTYPIHSAAEFFPEMTAEEFAALKEDIRKHGQREPIVLLDDQILDGRHRYRACMELGIEPDCIHHLGYIEEDDKDLAPEDLDPVAYVMSANLHRRHLSTSQRAIIAGKLANEHTTYDEAAKLLNVSPRSVATAKQVIDAAAEEIVHAVERGELPVSFAAKVIAEEPDTETQAELYRTGGKAALREHITEPSPYVDPDEDRRGSAVKTFQRLWSKWDDVQRTAIRVWLDEHFLDVK